MTETEDVLQAIGQLKCLTHDQVQKIFDVFYASDGKDSSQVTKYARTNRLGFSAIIQHPSYIVHLADGSSYILVAASSPDEIISDAPALCTPLPVYQSLLNLLSQSTSIPHPTPLYHSDALDIIPSEYLILSCPAGTPLSDLRRSGKLSAQQIALIDLQIGRWMREMHDQVQNDWFGLPKADTSPPAIPTFTIPGLSIPGFGQTDEEEPSYSWQETFTSLLESLMHAAETRSLASDTPFEELRKYLGRAIGSFLFDDCEVPSLISFLGDEGSVFVEIPEATEPRITSLLPPSYALYGDPLLETFFLSDDAASAPSQALLEGYGGNPIVFRRQKTKRVWYDVFLCLAVLVATRGVSDDDERIAKAKWAQQRLKESVEILKDAPCY